MRRQQVRAVWKRAHDSAAANQGAGGGDSALFRSYGREGRDELMDVGAAAVGALDLGFIDVRDVVVLGEFLVAVCAMKGVLRHRSDSEPTS